MSRSASLMRVYIVLIGSAMLSCAAVNQLNLLSTDQEVAIGRQAAAEIEQEIRLYKDPEITAYVDSLGQALVRHSKRPDLKYTFKVADTDEVNAFALPGGWVYINRGLMAASAVESELAGVIAHEIGHVVGQHGARQITRQFGLALLVELAVGEDENPTLARQVAGQFAAIGAGLTLLRYSRDAEREADAFAIEEMYAAGVDPEGMAGFFEKLLAMHKTEPSGVATWLSTHPTTTERIANVRADIRKLPPKPGLVKDTSRFRELKARIAKDSAGKN